MPKLKMSRQVATLWLMGLPVTVLGHHSLLGYEKSELIEVEGEVTSIFWRNPHIRLTVSTTAETGQVEVWTVEGGPINTMERIGISPERVHIGDNIKISGHASTRVENALQPVLVTLANGQALVLNKESASAFGLLAESAQTVSATADDEAVDAAVSAAHGIFRVWSNRERHWIQDSREWGVRVHPLQEAARLAQAGWNQPTDDIALQCIPAGMPEAMMMPFPIEFMEQDGDMLIHIEEWDNVRTIHMGDAATVADLPPSSLGTSLGHWEGNTLVVTTNNINYPFFDDRGTPMSEAVEIVERFTLSEDETRLDWTATVVDPGTFTEPVAMPELHWEWIPGEEVKEYNCTVAEN
jgi:hypothetical protein